MSNFLDPDDDSFYYGNVVKLNKVIKPFTQYLSERYGGKWKYHKASGNWNCNDGIRYVANVLSGRDFNGEYDGTTTTYLYYKDGRPTEIV